MLETRPSSYGGPEYQYFGLELMVLQALLDYSRVRVSLPCDLRGEGFTSHEFAYLIIWKVPRKVSRHRRRLPGVMQRKLVWKVFCYLGVVVDSCVYISLLQTILLNRKLMLVWLLSNNQNIFELFMSIHIALNKIVTIYVALLEFYMLYRKFTGNILEF